MSKKVDPKKIYTATEIYRLGLLPWARDSRTIVKYLESGQLKVKVSGKDTRKRYLVTGKELIKYINTFGPVLMFRARKSKAYGKKSNRENNQREA